MGHISFNSCVPLVCGFLSVVSTPYISSHSMITPMQGNNNCNIHYMHTRLTLTKRQERMERLHVDGREGVTVTLLQDSI